MSALAMAFCSTTSRPWLHKIPHARRSGGAIPYNQKRLRANYRDEKRFVIEPVAITRERGLISVKTFDARAIESGELPIEFVGCSSTTDTNLAGPAKTPGVKPTPIFRARTAQIEFPRAPADRSGPQRRRLYRCSSLISGEGADWTSSSNSICNAIGRASSRSRSALCPGYRNRPGCRQTEDRRYKVGIYAEDVWAFAWTR